MFRILAIVMAVLLAGCAGSRPVVTDELAQTAVPERTTDPSAVSLHEPEYEPSLDDFLPASMTLTDIDGSVEKVSVQDDAVIAQSASEQADAAISASPARFATAGEHQVVVTGTSFDPAATVVIVLCHIPGEPITAATSSTDLVRRVTRLDPVEACDVDRGVAVQTENDGSFAVHLTGSIDATTVVYAGAGDHVAIALVAIGE